MTPPLLTFSLPLKKWHSWVRQDAYLQELNGRVNGKLSLHDLARSETKKLEKNPKPLCKGTKEKKTNTGPEHSSGEFMSLSNVL